MGIGIGNKNNHSIFRIDTSTQGYTQNSKCLVNRYIIHDIGPRFQGIFRVDDETGCGIHICERII